MKRVRRILRRNPQRRCSTLNVPPLGGAKPASSAAVTQLRETVDATIDAYVDWRAACTDVRDAYDAWADEPVVDVELAYRVCAAAVDREEAAAAVYAELIRIVGLLLESGP